MGIVTTLSSDPGNLTNGIRRESKRCAFWLLYELTYSTNSDIAKFH